MNIIIEDRKIIRISGVKSVEKFTEEDIFLFTEKGDLVIKGDTLEVKEFDTERGNIFITGNMNTLTFTTDKYHLPDNFISRLFR
ncbi:MAG: YabP/YqfC family sporulation protein [Ruminiclostridium sp.]